MQQEGCQVDRSEEHTSELQSPDHLVCRLLLEKKLKPRVSAPLPPETPLTSGLVPLGGMGALLATLFFFNDAAPPEISPLSLHDALPITTCGQRIASPPPVRGGGRGIRPPAAS